MDIYSILEKYNINEVILVEAKQNVDLLDPRMRQDLIKPDFSVVTALGATGAGSGINYGTSLRNSLNLGTNYNVNYTDFGDAISVQIMYNNPKTGKSASQNFIILFDKTGKSVVKMDSVKWRTASGYSQVANYIRGRCSNLASKTS